MKTIIYDVEIARCVPDPNKPCDPQFAYCDGWHDYAGMGLSCVTVYDCSESRFRIFMHDNLDQFQELIDQSERIVGFNSKSFDDNVMRAQGIVITTTYDLLQHVRVASGQPAEYSRGLTRAGYSLGALARANLDLDKNGSGAAAPELWQLGRGGTLLDYALMDIQLTVRLYRLRRGLIDPTNGQTLELPY